MWHDALTWQSCGCAFCTLFLALRTSDGKRKGWHSVDFPSHATVRILWTHCGIALEWTQHESWDSRLFGLQNYSYEYCIIVRKMGLNESAATFLVRHAIVHLPSVHAAGSPRSCTSEGEGEGLGRPLFLLCLKKVRVKFHIETVCFSVHKTTGLVLDVKPSCDSVFQTLPGLQISHPWSLRCPLVDFGVPGDDEGMIGCKKYYEWNIRWTQDSRPQIGENWNVCEHDMLKLDELCCDYLWLCNAGHAMFLIVSVQQHAYCTFDWFTLFDWWWWCQHALARKTTWHNMLQFWSPDHAFTCIWYLWVTFGIFGWLPHL